MAKARVSLVLLLEVVEIEDGESLRISGTPVPSSLFEVLTSR